MLDAISLNAGISVETGIVVSAGMSAFLALLTVCWPLMEKGRNLRRIRAIATRREDLLMAARAPVRRSGFKTHGVGIAKRVAARFRLLRGKPADAAREKLQCAGYRSRDAVAIFLFLKLALPSLLGLLASLLLFGLGGGGLPDNARLPIALAVVLAGYYLPDLFLKNQTDKRREKLRRGLPDALDLMVICAEAGLTLDAGLVRVAKEIGPGAPELADELELASVELGFLPERRLALENLDRRVGLPSVTALVGTLGQAERYGTPLAQSLRVLAAEMRDERLMKAEEKAARLPATLTVPMVLFIMPALFIVLIGPGILRVLDSLRSL